MFVQMVIPRSKMVLHPRGPGYELEKYIESIQNLLQKHIAQMAGPRSAVGSASDSRARGPGFDTQSGHILHFYFR